MFNLFKKNNQVNVLNTLNITTDIHSHILPGLDDGSPDIASSIELVKGMYALGIRRAVATPHIIGDMFRNTPEKINHALEVLKAACRQQEIEIELSAAAEYMLDDHFMNLLKKKEILSVYNNVILTEMSYASPTGNLEEMAFEIITSGYQPIMAHPERYFYYHMDYENFFRLKELGFLLQVNLLSLTGYYGSPVAKAAKYILDKGLADFVGTDMHHTRHLNTLSDKHHISHIHHHLGEKVYNNF
jgi:tyrosine-protein phosphatase YwqE